jgi:hypothetical protein
MTQIVYMMIKEMLLSLIGRVAWQAIFERASTRLVIFGLKKLESYSTNQVVDDTVNDIINSLKGKGLKVIDDKDI